MLMFSGYRPLKNLMAVRFVHHRQWGSGCLRCPGNQSLAGEFQDLVADLQQLPVVADQDDPAAEILQGLADDRRGERGEIAGGLIQQQYITLGEYHGKKQDLGLLPSG